MTQQENHDHKSRLYSEISLSLRMLRMYVESKAPLDTLPSFYYSARKLYQYADRYSHNHEFDGSLFNTFHEEFAQFAGKNVNWMRKGKQERVVADIKRMLRSQHFTKHIQAKKKSDLGSGSWLKLQSQIDTDVSTTKPPQKKDDPQKSKLSGLLDEQALKKQKWLLGYNQCLKLDEDHIIDKAYQKAAQLEQQLLTLEYRDNSQQYLTQRSKLTEVVGKYKQMKSYHRYFDEQQWKFDKRQNGVDLHYRLYEEEKLISVLIESDLQVPITNFMPMICEVDLFDKYVPFCYGCELVKKLSRNEVVGHSKAYIPMLTDRQVYFYAVGYDRIDTNGTFFFYSKSINEDKEFQQKYKIEVPENKKYIKINYNFFIIEYKPLTATRGRVRIGTNVDLKMNYLPNWILSMAARKFAFTYFINIAKQQKDFGKSAWAEKLKSNPQFYEFFRQKVKLPLK